MSGSPPLWYHGAEERRCAVKNKAVFIDIDGTLLDFDAYVRGVLEEGFRVFGLGPFGPAALETFRRVNDALWHRLEEGEITRKELLDVRFTRYLEELGLEGDGPAFERLFRSRIRTSAIPVPGAAEMLRDLSRDFLLCVASNGPQEQQTERLRLAGMLDFFDFVFTSEGLGIQKPDPGFFRLAFERLNGGREVPLLPGDAAMVGDSVNSDVRGGKQWGMPAVLFCPGGPPPDCPADAWADALPKVPGLVRSLLLK